jgi:hypothetical protein
LNDHEAKTRVGWGRSHFDRPCCVQDHEALSAQREDVELGASFDELVEGAAKAEGVAGEADAGSCT